MKRYAIVGAGSRGFSMYCQGLKDHPEYGRLAAICDTNPLRGQLAADRLAGGIPVFTDYGDMLTQTKPDCVIVAGVDRTHRDHIVQALRAGCDVITEKPMTTDAESCRAVLAAERETGRRVTVTFNLRCGPFAARLKELMLAGAVGQVYSVHFEWMLDTRHGADYFRRWHRQFENAGSLLVHKATHHFDIVNWLLDDEPEEVAAFGRLAHYGSAGKMPAERCLTCPKKTDCPYYLDITTGELRALYLDCEQADGYYRDRCVFDPGIDIWDTMNVLVRYRAGAAMSYSLTAHAPYEGYRLVINGANGRLEADFKEGEVGFYAGQQLASATLYNRQGQRTVMEFPASAGTHAGADERLLRLIFANGPVEDPLRQAAGSHDGAMSILIGIAAGQSIRGGGTVRIEDLLKG